MKKFLTFFFTEISKRFVSNEPSIVLLFNPIIVN